MDGDRRISRPLVMAALGLAVLCILLPLGNGAATKHAASATNTGTVKAKAKATAKVKATAKAKGKGNGKGGGGGLTAELQELETLINSIAQEEQNLEEQVQMSMQTQAQLLSQLQGIQRDTLPEFDRVGEAQNAELEQLRMRLNGLLASFGPLEASMAGQRAVSEANEASTRPLKQGLDEVTAINNRQGAALVRVKTVLEEAKEKLQEKTGLRVQQSLLSVDSLQNNLNALTNFMGSRKCIQNTVMVEVDPETGSGSADLTLSPEGVFGSQMPSVLCLLEAFQSQAGLSNTQTDSGIKKNVALVINCQPSTDKVKVTAMDQSQGQENAITKAYVTVKACSLGAMV